MEWLQTIDWKILEAIQTLHCAAADAIFPVVTVLGNVGLVWIAAGLLCVCFRKTRWCGIAMLVGLLMGLLLCNLSIKPLVMRARPFTLRPKELLVAIPSEYSFPSGHAVSSFIASTVLWRRHRKWGAAAYVLAALIAFSRLYLYVHFPSDVFFGALLGVGIGVVSDRLCRAAEPPLTAFLRRKKE